MDKCFFDYVDRCTLSKILVYSGITDKLRYLSTLEIVCRRWKEEATRFKRVWLCCLVEYTTDLGFNVTSVPPPRKPLLYTDDAKFLRESDARVKSFVKLAKGIPDRSKAEQVLFGFYTCYLWLLGLAQFCNQGYLAWTEYNPGGYFAVIRGKVYDPRTHDLIDWHASFFRKGHPCFHPIGDCDVKTASDLIIKQHNDYFESLILKEAKRLVKKSSDGMKPKNRKPHIKSKKAKKKAGKKVLWMKENSEKGSLCEIGKKMQEKSEKGKKMVWELFTHNTLLMEYVMDIKFPTCFAVGWAHTVDAKKMAEVMKEDVAQVALECTINKHLLEHMIHTAKTRENDDPGVFQLRRARIQLKKTEDNPAMKE